jgi:hypothetical protein
MVAGTVLGVFIFFVVMASVFFVFTNVLDALNGSGFRNPRAPKEGQWRTKSGLSRN